MSRYCVNLFIVLLILTFQITYCSYAAVHLTFTTLLFFICVCTIQQFVLSIWVQALCCDEPTISPVNSLLWMCHITQFTCQLAIYKKSTHNDSVEIARNSGKFRVYTQTHHNYTDEIVVNMVKLIVHTCQMLVRSGRLAMFIFR